MEPSLTLPRSVSLSLDTLCVCFECKCMYVCMCVCVCVCVCVLCVSFVHFVCLLACRFCSLFFLFLFFFVFGFLVFVFAFAFFLFCFFFRSLRFGRVVVLLLSSFSVLQPVNITRGPRLESLEERLDRRVQKKKNNNNNI